MRWVCILFPQLALDAVLRQRADPQEPLALLTGPAQRRVLQAVNGPARALGLRPGQSMSAAQALSKGFATAEGLTVGVKATQITDWLKADFDLGHGHAMAIVALLKGKKS